MLVVVYILLYFINDHYYYYAISVSLTRHHISFFFGDNQVCYIGLCDKLETVILSITPEEKDEQINFNERLELIEFVYSKLQDLVKTFMKASQPPTPYIVCTCTCCNEEVHIKLDDILNCDELETPRCDKGKKVNEEYYSGLRQGISLYPYVLYGSRITKIYIILPKMMRNYL